MGTDGQLGGQATVHDVEGTWKDLTQNVNLMALNLTTQVREIASVTTAVANGDLSQKIKADVKGEILDLKVTSRPFLHVSSVPRSRLTVILSKLHGRSSKQFRFRSLKGGT